MCSCSAATRLGRNCTGTTTRAPNRRFHNMLALRVADCLVRERQHLAERQREVERRVGNGAKVGVDARLAGLLVGHDGES